MLAFSISPAPAFASLAAELPIIRAEATLYGLPIFTTDGVEIGAAAATGTDEDGHTVLLAGIAMPLGIGTQTVAIPLELLALRGDRIDLSLTATEVKERLSSGARDQGSAR